MSKVIVENKNSKFKMVDDSQLGEEVIMIKNRIGQGFQINTDKFSADDFRTLADHLEKIRGNAFNTM